VRDLLSSDFAKQQQARETSLITRFFYPKLGPGQMWEVVESQVVAAGGTVRHDATVTAVKMEGNRVSHVTVEDARTGQRETMACDLFFSTMPLRSLVANCEPTPPENVREVSRGLVYRDFLTVGVLLKRLHVREKGRAPQSMVRDNWIYVQDESVLVGRIQIFNNWSPYLVADPGTVWIGLEYFLNDTDELWRMSDDALGALALRELEKIGFARAEDAITTCVRRMPKAYPAYFGTYDRLSEIRSWVNGVPNLFCIGRNGMHRYNNQDHSMLTAMLAVDNIIAGRDDDSNLWDVNLEMVYQEE
jgi:protoporphyrinogen oxidase